MSCFLCSSIDDILCIRNKLVDESRNYNHTIYMRFFFSSTIYMRITNSNIHINELRRMSSSITNKIFKVHTILYFDEKIQPAKNNSHHKTLILLLPCIQHISMESAAFTAYIFYLLFMLNFDTQNNQVPPNLSTKYFPVLICSFLLCCSFYFFLPPHGLSMF